MSWATLEDVRARWADAPMNDALLSEFLQAAHEVVYEYAPAERRDQADIPQSWVEAEVKQTIEIGQTYDRDGDVIGFAEPGYSIRARPLLPEVKAKIRPSSGLPRIG